jgi:hypothetical protein
VAEKGPVDTEKQTKKFMSALQQTQPSTAFQTDAYYSQCCPAKIDGKQQEQQQQQSV